MDFKKEQAKEFMKIFGFMPPIIVINGIIIFNITKLEDCIIKYKGIEKNNYSLRELVYKNYGEKAIKFLESIF